MPRAILARALLAGLAVNLSALGLVAAETAPAAQEASAPAKAAPSEALKDLQDLAQRTMVKIRRGERTAEALAPEIAEFDALLAKHTEKNDDTAQIAFMKATLYLQVIGDADKGRELLEALKRDYPGTQAAGFADAALASAARQAKAKEAQAKLVGSRAPELNFTWSNTGELTTLSALEGKVVVLDFWATWCGPCIGSFPQVRELTAHYKDSPVVVIGVTSLQGRVHGLDPQPINTKDNPEREMALMHDFIKAKDITWQVAFSKEEVFNPDYGIQGIPFVAIIAPDGTVRHAGLHPSSPLEEKTEKINAILKEFGLPIPGKSS